MMSQVFFKVYAYLNFLNGLRLGLEILEFHGLDLCDFDGFFFLIFKGIVQRATSYDFTEVYAYLNSF